MVKINLVCVICLMLFSLTNSKAQNAPLAPDTLCTPNPSPEAVSVFRYLQDMNGNRTLSGQMWAPWGINEQLYVEQNTGKTFAIKGGDFIHERENSNEIKRAVDFWKSGGIPTIMWHWGAPAVGEGYENSKVKIDISKCFIEGTAEYTSMWTELKLKADYLEELRDANVPILWRPFHEHNGGWFWWGMQGADNFIKLWQTMFNYFVYERKLNNLIWVLGYTGSPNPDWNPGNKFVDIYGADSYDGGNSSHEYMFNKAREIAGKNSIPVAYHECGIPPDPDECINDGAIWSWWMEWHTGHLTDIDKDYLKMVYDHELIITLDELPDLSTEYSWSNTCYPSTVTPTIVVDDDQIISGNTIFAKQGVEAILKPETSDKGTFKWKGIVGDENLQEQSIKLTEPQYLLVEFTNFCGAKTTQAFNVINDCYSKITPFMQVNNGEIKQTTYVYINKGDEVKLMPTHRVGGSWQWTGTDISDTTPEIVVSPEVSSVYQVSLKNTCQNTFSESFIVYVNEETEIEHPDASSTEIVVKPNPFVNVVSIEVSPVVSANGATICLYNSVGKLIMSQYTNQNITTLNTHTLDTGMYLLFVKSNEFIYSQKIIKQK